MGLAARIKKARYAGQFARRRRKECKPPSSVIMPQLPYQFPKIELPRPLNGPHYTLVSLAA